MAVKIVSRSLAPIVLYPDPLLAQLLPAGTYPQEVALAAQWLQYNPNPSEIVIAMQNWDASIKAMVHYPTVLQYMNTNLQWTEALGVAFLNQQGRVYQKDLGPGTLSIARHMKRYNPDKSWTLIQE